MKIIGMIPARLGSKRVPRKNLRLINGRPLISYNIQSAVKSGIFDEVYVNSESEILLEIAQEYGAKFYKRSSKLAGDGINNDDFAQDFINNIPGDILVQILPTSPLITIDEIKNFVGYMIDNDFDTCVSTVKHQIASLFKGDPINFNIMESHISSQDMDPVETYATVFMGWKYLTFQKNMSELGFAYHGGKGTIGYFPIEGLSTIDIDNEEDFNLAEVALRIRSELIKKEPEYYKRSKDIIEVDVPQILKNDGIEKSNFDEENKPLADIKKIITNNSQSVSWCHRLVNTENNSATLVAQMPGEGNRLHFHPNWNEWWLIMQGKWEWIIEGKKTTVKEGDFVFIEKGKKHQITAIGDKMAIRLAVSRADVQHVYPE